MASARLLEGARSRPDRTYSLCRLPSERSGLNKTLFSLPSPHFGRFGRGPLFSTLTGINFNCPICISMMWMTDGVWASQVCNSPTDVPTNSLRSFSAEKGLWMVCWMWSHVLYTWLIGEKLAGTIQCFIVLDSQLVFDFLSILFVACFDCFQLPIKANFFF